MALINEFLDDIFHSCALAAFVDIAQETKTNTPDKEVVRKLAYKYYEDYRRELKNAKMDS